MKYFPLIWAGVWRKRSRAVLLLLQIVSAFLLFGLLQGVDSGVQQVIASAHRDRLYVQGRVAMGGTLPLAMLARIQSIHGAREVTPVNGVIGTYQKRDQHIYVSGVYPAVFFRIYDDVTRSPGSLAALRNDRIGALATTEMMRKYGWRIGQKIALQTEVAQVSGSSDWEFDIVGTYAVPPRSGMGFGLIVNFAYLNDSRVTGRDQADAYFVKADRPADADTVALAIDNAFANSPNETHTQSEADLLQSSLQQLGDLGFIVHGVVGAIFFAVLFATGALMMQSVRERRAELATLKAVGFADRGVMLLLMAESAVFCIVSALIGLGLATLILPFAHVHGVPRVPGIVYAAGVACALALAVVAAGIPALRAARLPVAVALSDR